MQIAVAKYVVPPFRWLKTHKNNKNDVDMQFPTGANVSRGHAPTVHCFRCNFSSCDGGITWIRVDGQKRACSARDEH